jgi:cytochrome d ubiquinol oxidase subunit II
MGLVLLLAVGTLFGNLWPNVMPSTTNSAFSLTVRNASSSPYTLGVMSWVALFFTPVVLAYQAWSYWVFRKRVTGHVDSGPGSGQGDAGHGGSAPVTPVTSGSA